ncbi:hypothetical protein A6U97_02465 [Agrobacterium tumefaciens]|uniref:hypothetical protein n=1 Tax=Agrobacterium tumefaciens TaxID=358 RepID=UPI00080FDEBE|nr:hypothetical protein A6U97_02465 [Agrobacterium tumefaciens]
MDKFLEIVGGLGASLVLLVMILITANSGGGSATALTILAMLPWAVPAIVGFVIIAAFGNMLGQLKAIRAANERQNEIMNEFLRSVAR